MPPLPPAPASFNESERLRSLRAFGILAALAEPVFDDFVALTAQVFGLPISLIAVVEEADVHYPTNHGMSGHSWQPRECALCSTAIEQARAVVYRDLALEPGTAVPAEALAAAASHGLRFYAGTLLRLPDQQPFGTLCVIDQQPRAFSPEEQHMLDQLAALVSRTIAVRYAHHASPPNNASCWQSLCTQLQEELRELTALVRYLFTRHGGEVPVPASLLAQIMRRLPDLHRLLAEHAA